MVETICHCHCAVNRLKPFFTRFNSFYELLSLRCRRRNPIVTADALFFLSFVLSFFLSFFLFYSTFERNLHSLLLRGNEGDRLENLTQRAEWSHFAFQQFFLEIWPQIKNTAVFCILARHPCEAVSRLATEADRVSPWTPRCPWSAAGRPTITRGVGLEHCSDAICRTPMRATQRALDELTHGNSPTFTKQSFFS